MRLCAAAHQEHSELGRYHKEMHLKLPQGDFVCSIMIFAAASGCR